MKKYNKINLITLVLFLLFAPSLFSYPLEFTDSDGRKIVVNKMPERVVSVVPSVTEAIFKMGAGDQVKGVTYHSLYPSEVVLKPVVGGFFSPSLESIEAKNPDMIFISDLHEELIKNFRGKCVLINLDGGTLEKSFEIIRLLGKIFNKEKEAREIIDNNLSELEIIKSKTAKIAKKKRVIRLMGRGSVMTPGDDSFQNDIIKRAGCISPETGKKGKIITMTLDEWKKFNPQVIYGCGGDRSVFDTILSEPGWRDVDAVKNKRYLSFPCELTCRASTNVGYFAGWLAAGVYPEIFADKKKQVIKEEIIESKPVICSKSSLGKALDENDKAAVSLKSSDKKVDLGYVKSAEVKREYIHDFINKTLVIEFNRPMALVSSLEGYREGIKTVGNHYFPAQTWGLGHAEGLKGLRKRIYGVLGLDEKNASFLFTGANMDYLSVKTKHFKEMKVIAFVTAGVRDNALKMAKDNGGYYEPGTINIILMSNMQLSKRAMTRAIISATEAKTAALSDMDIRSSESPLVHQATGTGTDNIIVVEGEGPFIDNAGGHSKMGELIAKAVYDGVKEAVFKQNGILAQRNIFQRLKERKITISTLGNISANKAKNCDCVIEKSKFKAAIESTLLKPEYSAFLEMAFAISDDYENGIITNIDSFKEWSQSIAKKIAGKEDLTMKELVDEDLPVVLKIALNALLNGVVSLASGGSADGQTPGV